MLPIAFVQSFQVSLSVPPKHHLVAILQQPLYLPCVAILQQVTYMPSLILTREERGKIIAEKPNQIMRLEERFYKVTSQSGHGMYDVIKKKESSGWLCTCPDFAYRNVQCKHIWAVQFSLRLREQVEARVIEPITDIHACLFCKSEQIISKD